MNRGSFELSVAVNRDGRATPLREFGHNGFTYIESREGTKFVLKFRNNTASRVLAVPSIDGLSVLEGGKATPQSRGYIVPAYTQVEIRGWRTSLNDINDFVFERKETGKTYSEGVGEGTGNCGVIAIKVFSEKEKPKPKIIREEHHHHHHHDHYPTYPPYRPPWKPWPEYWCSTGGTAGGSLSGHITKSVDPETFGSLMSSVAGPKGACGPVGEPGPPGVAGESYACFMNSVAEPEFTSDQTLGLPKEKITFSAAPAFNMGCGFGQHQVDRVTEEFFERGRELALLEIYFTDAGALKEIGIDVEKKVAVNVMPQSFAAGFCKAPVAR
jgi:hypothetical protein